MALLQFLLNTAAESANKPGSKLFLPDRLAEISGSNSQGKLLPFEQPNINVGKVTGPGRTVVTTNFLNQWGFYLEATQFDKQGQHPIPDPANPDPMLEMGQGPDDVVTIDGIRNVYISNIEQVGETNTETSFRVTLDLNHWNETNGGGDTPALAVIGPYVLSQAMCLAKPNEDTCSGLLSADIKGRGTTTVLITNAQIIAEVTVAISGDPGNRSLSVAISDINIGGIDKDTQPVLTVKDLTIQTDIKGGMKIWKRAATQALQNQSTSDTIFGIINERLKSQDNRDSVAKIITEQLHNVMNDLLGKVDGPLPQSINQGGQTLVDGYLYNRMFYSMNTPTSDWFLPRTICKMSNPRLDPYEAGTVAIPNQKISGIEFTNIALKDLEITGLSNLSAPAKTTVFTPGSITINAGIADLQPPPKLDCCTIPASAHITAKFSAEAAGVKLPADISVDIGAATLALTANALGEVSSELKVTVTEMEVKVSDLSKLKIDVKIDSSFSGFVNELLNGDNIKKQILSELNKQLTKYLPQISDAATQYGQSIINSNIG